MTTDLATTLQTEQDATSYLIGGAAIRTKPALAAAVAVVSIDGRILYANPAADILFRLQDGFAVHSNRLELPRHSSQLRHALAAASGLGHPAEPCVIAVNRPGHAWRVICLPLPPNWVDRALASPGASLVLVLSNDTPEPSSLWQLIYGLSMDDVFLASRLMFEQSGRAPWHATHQSGLTALQDKTGAQSLDSLRTLLQLSAGFAGSTSN